jgi:hypothetical protein
MSCPECKDIKKQVRKESHSVAHVGKDKNQGPLKKTMMRKVLKEA